ncbi:small-conductance mechanosensitive channel [Methanofollis sp. W23]|uniref:hypothetical protein n=1 Tax=Methanofollis sp. W23 TaxID=2817849 RepID=UPI001AE9050E|nr:hypothetical protein [Methanofollis sp. W23]MBP2144830.1 small-conductance mechanosensitive channel [Methanofollis sp. W23]
MLNKFFIPVVALAALVALYGMITGQWMITVFFIALGVVLVALWRWSIRPMLKKFLIPATVLVTLLAIYCILTAQWIYAALFLATALALALVALWKYW